MQSMYPTLTDTLKRANQLVLGHDSVDVGRNFESARPLSSDYNALYDDETDDDVTNSATAPLLSSREIARTTSATLAHAEKRARFGKADAKCILCRRELVPDKALAQPSLVVYGACEHVVHLACVAKTLRERHTSSFDENAWQKTCTACAVVGDDAVSRSSGTHAKWLEDARDPQTILRGFKARFTKESGGMSYDEFKHTTASDDVKCYILGLSDNGSGSGGKEALMRWIPGLTAMAKQHEASKESQAQLRERVLSSASFVELMVQRGRTLDDVLALAEGSLLQLYRCGVQRLADLRRIGFNPITHLSKPSIAAKVPAWQLYDLYDMKFEHFISDSSAGGFELLPRDVCESVRLRAPEWTLLGATAERFAALHVDARHLAHMMLPVAKWEKYLCLERAHLPALGINTHADFVNTMGWDPAHHLCPPK